ncbi:MAG TPA: phosphatase PAP2 family protein [Cellvibrio sp.]|nr:phosphatase PAP2 family protein [Cellvibrio sp.]
MKFSLAAAALLILVGLVLNSFPAQNQSLFFAINSLLPISSLWIAITTVGDGAVAGCLFYILFRRQTDLLVKGLIGGVLGLIASQGLKKLFAVPRPEHTLDFGGQFYLLTESMTATNYSMPSGHTVTAFLLGTLLLYFLKLNTVGRIVLVLVMIAIALSRVALGVHWPADVLVGAGLGIFIAVICISLPISVANKWARLATHILYVPFVAVLVYTYFL